METKMLSERLLELAKAAQDRADSSKLVAGYLQPEIDHLHARTGHNIYAARMAVDHRNSAKTDTKEAALLREAAAVLARVEVEVASLELRLATATDHARSLLDDSVKAEARAQRAEADAAGLRELIGEVVADVNWRTDNNELWPRLCKAMQGRG